MRAVSIVGRRLVFAALLASCGGGADVAGGGSTSAASSALSRPCIQEPVEATRIDGPTQVVEPVVVTGVTRPPAVPSVDLEMWWTSQSAGFQERMVGHVKATDRASGTLLWQITDDSTDIDAADARGEVVVLRTSTGATSLTRLVDARSGAGLLCIGTSAPESHFSFTDVEATKGATLLSRSPARFYAFSVKSGLPLWSLDWDVPGGALEVHGSDRYAVAKPLWRRGPGGPLLVVDAATGAVVINVVVQLAETASLEAIWVEGNRVLFDLSTEVRAIDLERVPTPVSTTVAEVAISTTSP